jgi:hypothetical protein
MGSANSTENNDESPVNLAMMAVARKIHLERGQILTLRNAMAGYADEDGTVNRQIYNHSLVLSKLVGVEIFDLLFTMWDYDGKGRIPVKGFCVGISPLACPHADLRNILRFALRVCDDRNLGCVRAYDLQTLLDGINSTASYFGDVHLSREEIRAVMESTFEGGIYKLAHVNCIHRLCLNPYIKRFAAGRTRAHVRFKAELVTEIRIEPPRSDHSPLSPILLLENQSLQENQLRHRRQRRRGHGVKRISPRSLQKVASLVDKIPSFDEGTDNTKQHSIDPPSSLHYPHRSSQNRRTSRDP